MQNEQRYPRSLTVLTNILLKKTAQREQTHPRSLTVLANILSKKTAQKEQTHPRSLTILTNILSKKTAQKEQTHPRSQTVLSSILSKKTAFPQADMSSNPILKDVKCWYRKFWILPSKRLTTIPAPAECANWMSFLAHSHCFWVLRQGELQSRMTDVSRPCHCIL